jgi:hypothetical protein
MKSNAVRKTVITIDLDDDDELGQLDTSTLLMTPPPSHAHDESFGSDEGVEMTPARGGDDDVVLVRV